MGALRLAQGSQSCVAPTGVDARRSTTRKRAAPGRPRGFIQPCVLRITGDRDQSDRDQSDPGQNGCDAPKTHGAQSAHHASTVVRKPGRSKPDLHKRKAVDIPVPRNRSHRDRSGARRPVHRWSRRQPLQHALSGDSRKSEPEPNRTPQISLSLTFATSVLGLHKPGCEAKVAQPGCCCGRSGYLGFSSALRRPACFYLARDSQQPWREHIPARCRAIRVVIPVARSACIVASEITQLPPDHQRPPPPGLALMPLSRTAFPR